MANPWYAHYPADYEAKTAHLSLIEDGAYRRLLDHYYRIGRALPANAEVLPRVCRAFADDEKAAVLKVLHEFFHLEDDGWHNDRADEELAKASQISEKRRDAGKKGAEKTNSQRSANAAASVRQMPTQHNTTQHIKDIGAKRATQFPEGYQPNTSHKELAANLNVDLREEFPAFRDYHTSKGNTFKNWDAALNTWIRNAKKFTKQTVRIPLEVGVSHKNPAVEMRRQLEAD